jgi:hypothetical protein
MYFWPCIGVVLYCYTNTRPKIHNNNVLDHEHLLGVVLYCYTNTWPTIHNNNVLDHERSNTLLLCIFGHVLV